MGSSSKLAARGPDIVASVNPLVITVIGGGGMIGSRVVREALDRGHAVTVVVRNPSNVAASDDRLTVVAGDVLDGAIAGLVEGHDVVIALSELHAPRSPTTPSTWTPRLRW